MRQDALIAESLLGPFNDDDDNGDDGIEKDEDEEKNGRNSRYRSPSSSLLSSLEYLCHTSSDVDINLDGSINAYNARKGDDHNAGKGDDNSKSSPTLKQQVIAAIMQRVKQLGNHYV